MRLDKYLADMKMGTRSEIKKFIRQKEVRVNGSVITDPGFQVEETAEVTLFNEKVAYIRYEYYLLNKPAGYLCTKDDPVNVLQLISSNVKNLNPVGRLDKDTEGVLIITNDGELAHRLISPKNHVNKTYYVETDSDIPDNAAAIFEKPMQFSDFTSAPAEFVSISKRSGNLTIHEGKYHQVKRMFAAIGCEVVFLKRIRFSILTLDNLKTGEYRKLTEEEIRYLKAI